MSRAAQSQTRPLRHTGQASPAPRLPLRAHRLAAHRLAAHRLAAHRLAALALAVAACASAPLAQAGTVESDLAIRLKAARPYAPVSVIVRLQAQIDPLRWDAEHPGLARKQRPARLFADLKKQADSTQPSVVAALKKLGADKVKNLIAINAVAVEIQSAKVAAVAALPGVATVGPDNAVDAPAGRNPLGPLTRAERRAQIEGERGQRKPKDPKPLDPRLLPLAQDSLVPWHLDALDVPALHARGIDGRGVTVAILDTGVDGQHPELKGSFRAGPRDWFDPFSQFKSPADPIGHGTNVAGVIAAAREGKATSGVAPGAKWIAARLFDSQGKGSLSTMHAVFDWAMDPDGNAATNDAPDVVNASWGLGSSIGLCNREFTRDIGLLRIAGIHVVFAAGNEGPGPNTGMSPANNSGAISVGASGSDGVVTVKSSRGPSPCEGAGEYPTVLAPGQQIVTTDPVSQTLQLHTTVDGTSFAAGMVSGTLALMRQRQPEAALAEVEKQLLLSKTASGTVDPLAALKLDADGPRSALALRFDLDPGSALLVPAPDGLRGVPRRSPIKDVAILEAPAAGKLAISNEGELRYEPGSGRGAQRAKVKVTTTDGRVTDVALTLNVPTLDKPLARDDAVSVAHGQTLAIKPLTNDLAPDGARLAVATLTLASAPSRGGRAEVQPDGTILYTPRDNFRGTDTFAYVVRDERGRESNRAAVRVRVQ